jgi:hypothetical protein
MESADVWSRTGTKALPYVGAALIFVGIALILLGWRGAANTPLLFEQVPYLISGGLLGTALVALGGLLYFSYWLTVVARDQRETHRLLEALLEQGSGKPAEPISQSLVVTARGNMVHRETCPVVRDRDDLRPVGDSSGLESCGICSAVVPAPAMTDHVAPQGGTRKRKLREPVQ